MQRPNENFSVPRATKAVFEAVVQITDDVCLRHLNAEYAVLPRRLTAVLARKRPAPLLKRTSRTWACGVVYALGNLNCGSSA